MTGQTHIVAGVAAAAVVATVTHHSLTPALIVCGGLGGLAPDLDHPEALLTRHVPGMSWVVRMGQVAGWWRHRGLWHSLLFWIGTLILVPVLGRLMLHGLWAVGVGLGHPEGVTWLRHLWGSGSDWGWGAGYLSHMLIDTWNTTGVQWFWPVRLWVHSPVPNILVGTWPETLIRWGIQGALILWRPELGILVVASSWGIYQSIHWI